MGSGDQVGFGGPAGMGGFDPLTLLGISNASVPPPPHDSPDPAQSFTDGTGITPPFLGVGRYRGRGPGGPGSDYYGWPDLATLGMSSSQTKFPPPQHFFGQGTKVL